MMVMLGLLAVPPIVILGFRAIGKMEHEVTITEVAALIVICSLLSVPGYFAAKNAAMSDYEFWNGRVSDKPDGTQSCCHCRTVCDRRDDDGHCTASHQECDHTRDYWWAVDYTTGDRITVESCSGSSRPPRAWVEVEIGDVATIPHSYKNFLKADPESVYRQSDLAVSFGERVPAYPGRVGLHWANKAIEIGNTPWDSRLWNSLLMEMNADLNQKGRRKKVNVVVVVTDYRTAEAAKSVEHEWLYGKMNDAIFVFGVDPSGSVLWSELVSTPGHQEAFKTAVRHGFKGDDITDNSALYHKIEAMTEAHWRWDGIDDFKYLASAAKPPTWAIILLYLFAALISGIGTAIAASHSFFGDEAHHFGGRRRGWRKV